MPVMQKITPCLWFDDQAEEAVAFIPRSLETQGSSTWLGTEKRDMRSTENRRERS
jgi:predicted 3-demethylubiquinone-9 3-methyltransferase (glyoxalase superfamily)